MLPLQPAARCRREYEENSSIIAMTRSISKNPASSGISQPVGPRLHANRDLGVAARSPQAFATLRAKTVLIVVVTQLALLVILAAPLRLHWLANFRRLEAQMLTTDVNRAMNGIVSDIQALDMLNTSYAIWDDTYAFVDDRNQDYIKNNFYDQPFVDNRLNLVLLVDSSGQVVFGKAFDLTTRRAVPLPDRLQQISSHDPLIEGLTPTNSITGVLDLPLAPMVLASHAIVTSQGAGPIRGALLMGRYLNATEIQRLAASTQIAFTIQRRAGSSPDLAVARQAFESDAPVLIQPLGDSMIAASAPLNDLDRSDSLLVRVETARRVYAEGQQGVAYFIAAFLIAGMVFGAILLILLERVVLARLTQLSTSVSQVGTQADLSLRVPVDGNDELGQLADAFNQTLSTLEAAETERIQLYREARESEQKYRAILNAIPDAILRISRNGICLDFRVSQGNKLSMTPEQIVGKTVQEIAQPAVAQQTMACIERALQTGDVQLFEFQSLRFGEPLDYEARIVVTGTDEVQAIFRDITERKKIDRMKNEFIATVSHELRTPLTSLRGALGLINGGVIGELPVQAKELIDVAYKNSERLVLLVNAILDTEKIEAARLDCVRQPLELLPVLEQALELNRPYGAQFGVTFTLGQIAPGVWVEGDADRLIQVLSNLLSNAAKFSPPNGEVMLALTCHDQAVRVSVTDHGPGVPESFRSRIFTKFAQADASDARRRGGTGLGLSICRAIIEQLGGTIDYETSATTGTTFYFDLPEYRKIH